MPSSCWPKAGYPDGRDAKTGRPLVMNYDYHARRRRRSRPELDWMVRQFGKLGMQLDVRATDNNQFQDKVRRASTRSSGGAGTPTTRTRRTSSSCSTGPNGKRVSDGENTANYSNPEYDKLYRQMQALDDGPEAGGDRPDAGSDRAAGRALEPGATIPMRRWLPALGAQPNPILIRDHGRYCAWIDQAARAARRVEPAGGGRWRSSALVVAGSGPWRRSAGAG